MRDDRFEWDDAKAASNLSKHGIAFEQARDAFDDRNLVEDLDDDPDQERWKLIGMTTAGLPVVIHTARGYRNRIISAREAEPHEQDQYRRQAHS